MANKNISNEYTHLRIMIAQMCELSSEMVDNAIKALVEQDIALAAKTAAQDIKVDKLDIEIDQHCMKMIALYEPKAADLRFIITAMRLIVDLERIGDHAKNIAKQVPKLNTRAQVKPYIDLPVVAKLASDMVKDAVDAYFDKNEDKALAVLSKDSKIDALENRILKDLIMKIKENTDNTKSAITLINITRRIERIADHAKNIAELVAYMVTGEILRHKESPKELLNSSDTE